MEQAPLAEGEGRCLHQVVAHPFGQGGQVGPGTLQGRQGAAAALGHQGRQAGQALEAIGEGHQVAGGGAAGAGAAGGARQR